MTRCEPAEEGETCQMCQGNGEVVTDWDRYLHAHPGDIGDEAVAECPDCDGCGKTPAALKPFIPQEARTDGR